MKSLPWLNATATSPMLQRKLMRVNSDLFTPRELGPEDARVVQAADGWVIEASSLALVKLILSPDDEDTVLHAVSLC